MISRFKKKIFKSDNEDKIPPHEDKIEVHKKEIVSSPDKTILFVCMSNKVVSPIAETLFNQKVKNIKAISAGITPMTGEKISSEVVDLFKTNDIDLSGYLTTNIDDIPIDEIDLILTSTIKVRDSLKIKFNRSDIFTIKEYSGVFDDLDINLSKIESCFNEVNLATDKIIELMGGDVEINEEFDIENDKLLIRNFNHLESLINSGEKNIVLDCNFALDDDETYDYTDGIEINADGIIIDGNGCSIDAKGFVRIFRISGKNITFRNILFKNGFSQKKGGCISSSDAYLKFFDCDFIGNTSKYEGGAIYNSESEITFDNCNFIENDAKWYGGALSNSEGLFKFNECEFKNNFSKKNGCEILNSGYIELNKSTVYNESCPRNNSLIYNAGSDSSLSIFNSKIKNKLGKIVYLEQGNSTIESTTIKTDEKNDDYLVYNKTGHIKLKKLELFSSSINTIFSDNIVRVEEDDEIINHIELGDNGVIKTKQDTTSGSNNFEYLYCLIEHELHEITLDEDILMSEDEQAFFEGGIELCQDGLTIEGNNHTIDASDFSRIFLVTGKNITLKNIIFKNGRYWSKYFDTKKEGGGAISITKNASLNLIGCTFIDNNSKKSAGAILSNGKINIENCEFRNNGAKNHSGVILNKNYDLNIKHCLFIDNMSGEDGSCIYNENGNLIVENESLFKDNQSNRYGGAIYIEHSDFELISSEFRNNKSKSGGGSIYIKNSNLFKIESSIFEENYSYGKGGAIYNLGVDNIVLNENCIFQNNESANEGGAIYLFDTYSRIDIGSTTFKFNKAISGGAIFNLSSSATIHPHLIIEKCDFANNMANVGGAITNGLYMECYSCHFEDNNTTEESGFISNGGKSHFHNCEFKSKKSGETLIYNIDNSISSFRFCRVLGNFMNLSINYGSISFEGTDFEKEYEIANKGNGSVRGDY